MSLLHAIRAHLHGPAQTSAAKLEEVEARFKLVKADPSPENIASLGKAILRLHLYGKSVFVEHLGFSIAESNEAGDTGIVVYGPGSPEKDDDNDEG